MSVKSEDFFAVFSVSLASNPMLCALQPYALMSCLAHYQCLTMYFSNVSTCTIVLSLLQLLLAEPPVDELAGDAHFLRDVR